ncbi:nicotinate-nucleotide diphosphorylase (carboxylating) [Sporosarcina sp. P21c]|uniref:carboxylating nicotinate-nucleotide diphosphorylase n=1 Tax=unclassified Sporosarcina TaxID=2647733 RepID=UPI000C16AACC|nr:MULTISPECIES: carboxylating nicotinate-nucleotide diphosphorylase [unclassified Sporosarcina]PIC68546.1 nicotinate-nucleotide diphosphorylase (carboxylating) [Sporosarcina sp. P16a]PIC91268.1 nicotinate-nucleotide diphosphorylase (carboxylating) [Sporosarcina sp. P21c]PIC93599.1 nicotinate-nucleotide diphosphorylase (carboxylating) [Sporosarcina sp. P25]
MNRIKLVSMLEQFFIEDVGDGDLSANTLFPADAIGEMQIISKTSGVFCGVDVITTGFQVMNPSIEVECLVEDGERITDKQVLAIVKGCVRDLLTAERVVLNCIQRMSAIATKTADLTALLSRTKTRVCDTRKTAPGLRMLDKYAVRTGGGFNHRNGLYDAVMLKDNHLAYAGSITNAVQLLRTRLGHTVKIEVEIESLTQLQEAIEANVDIIMFDNRSPQEITDWLPLVPAHIMTEASGMITEDTIASYGKTGIDYISVGALTHSVMAADISATIQLTTQED